MINGAGDRNVDRISFREFHRGIVVIVDYEREKQENGNQ